MKEGSIYIIVVRSLTMIFQLFPFRKSAREPTFLRSELGYEHVFRLA